MMFSDQSTGNTIFGFFYFYGIQQRSFGLSTRRQDSGLATGRYLHELNLKEAIRVLQLKLPVVLKYSWVYQKVQSSLASIAILL